MWPHNTVLSFSMCPPPLIPLTALECDPTVLFINQRYPPFHMPVSGNATFLLVPDSNQNVGKCFTKDVLFVPFSWQCVCSNRRARALGHVMDASWRVMWRDDLSVVPSASQVEEMQHHVNTLTRRDALVSLIMRHHINTHVPDVDAWSFYAEVLQRTVCGNKGPCTEI